MPDVTIEDAANILWVLASFDSFDALYSGRGMTTDDVARMLITMAERSLYARSRFSTAGLAGPGQYSQGSLRSMYSMLRLSSSNSFMASASSAGGSCCSPARASASLVK